MRLLFWRLSLVLRLSVNAGTHTHTYQPAGCRADRLDDAPGTPQQQGPPSALGHHHHPAFGHARAPLSHLVSRGEPGSWTSWPQTQARGPVCLSWRPGAEVRSNLLQPSESTSLDFQCAGTGCCATRLRPGPPMHFLMNHVACSPSISAAAQSSNGGGW
jgi:hypothetical protein